MLARPGGVGGCSRCRPERRASWKDLRGPEWACSRRAPQAHVTRGDVMKYIKPLLAIAIAAVIGISARAEQPVANPAELGFDPDRLEWITKAFQNDVDAAQIPGAVVLIARRDRIAYFKAIGFRDR